MAPHSSTLAWRIPWMEEPGGLQSMGSLRVGHDWATSLSLFTFMHWRRKWQPTPVFLPRESQGRGSLVGCHLWGNTESVTTEATQQQQQQWGLLFLAVCGLLIAVGSRYWACALGTRASVLAECGLSCSSAREIFPDQGSNRCPLRCKADS